MRTSQQGLDFIKAYEGCRLNAYRCPSGVWTIGYGHTKGVTPGTVWTQEQANSNFIEDLKEYEGYVNAYGLSLSQAQFDMLVSFTYNCGPGNLRKLLAHSDPAAALHLFNRGSTGPLPGLIRRRAEESSIYKYGYKADQSRVVNQSTPAQFKKDIKNNSSKSTWIGRVWATLTASTGAFFTADTLRIGSETVDQIKTFATANWVPLLCLAGVLLFIGKKWLEKKQADDAASGNYIPSQMEDTHVVAE